MKVIMFAAGSDGDIHPHMGLGCELVSRGHQVVFVTTLNYVDMAREFGFEAIGCFEEAFVPPEDLSALGKIKANFQFFSDVVTRSCRMVGEHIDSNSILIGPPFAFAVARLLQLQYGTPYLSTALAPSNILLSLKTPPVFKQTQWFAKLPYPLRRLFFFCCERWIIDPIMGILLRDPARRLGIDMPPAKRTVRDWVYSSQCILGLFGDWFAPRPEDWPAHIVATGFPLFHPRTEAQELSDGLARFLRAGPPPIVFTAGTDTKDPRRFFEDALKAVETLKVRAVFLTRLTDQLPSLPDTIWHESYTSLGRLLPQISVLVHHGGIGTTAQALHAGVPQLIVPERMDQFDNGKHIEHLGCGLLQNGGSSGDSFVKNLRHLLSDQQVLEACGRIKILMEPGDQACSRAADLVEEVFSRVIKSSRPVVFDF